MLGPSGHKKFITGKDEKSIRYRTNAKGRIKPPQKGEQVRGAERHPDGQYYSSYVVVLRCKDN